MPRFHGRMGSANGGVRSNDGGNFLFGDLHVEFVPFSELRPYRHDGNYGTNYSDHWEVAQTLIRQSSDGHPGTPQGAPGAPSSS